MSLYTQWSRFRTSFQFKIFSIFTVLTFLITCLLGSLYIVGEIRTTRHEATEQLQLRALRLAEMVRIPLYAENREVLLQAAEQVVTVPEIRAVVISAPDGRVLAEVHSSDYVPHSLGSNKIIRQSVEVRSNPFVDSLEAAIVGTTDTASTLIGRVRIERGTEDLSRIVRRAVGIAISVATLFWVAVSGLSHLVLRKLTHSFNMLMQGIQAMQKGNFTSRITIDSDDEPSWAAVAINDLARALKYRSEENARLQAERLDFERQMFQAQKLESLGIMAGGIAHDFNNLLQSILGNMELASMKLDAGSVPQKYINQATNSATRAALLAGMMLTYVGKGIINKKALNLNQLIRENADMLRTAASSAVSMELLLAEELPAILADEAYIQQVVMNLITNAAESIVEQPGIIKITTGTRQYDTEELSANLLDEKPKPGHFVFMEVSDNGCGMSTDTMNRLFDPFFTTKFTGRGLGMSAVMGIMRTHNGALFVTSTPGVGTTFRALFPEPTDPLTVEVQKPAPAPPLETTAETENSFSGLALVVDDEKPVLKVCTKMMSLCGFTVITASDGNEAVAIFRKRADEIVIVLMDMTMPNMDGISAMNELFAIKPDCRIILASGFNEEELSSRLSSQTPTGFISKPYNMKKLREEVQRVMQVS
jgi:signal transduction histidine kinase/CheY-like chemotaxis protein